MSRRNGTKAQRLIELWTVLQDRNTTLIRIMALSTECGIDARRVLADHFQQGQSRA
ncbi:hypothetical protein [Pseudomonas lactis]|uniref:hypothetical protein n=1 Tax=Pseudomonas lactis TaxID=1615674 RepID=UPI00190C9FF8|nr:hypothetical protein [Pseudomonas lactis]MBK3444146.1 hypothetical protein [Pseudomonas lactis]